MTRAVAAGCLMVSLAVARLPAQASLEPRIVGASIDHVWIDRVDLSLRIAVRAEHSLTVRSVAFTDAFIDSIPVWIAPVEGNWPLREGQDFVLPQPLLVSVYARDVVGAENLGSLVRKAAVTLSATVDVTFATPWPARLLLMGPSQSAVTDVTFTLPVSMGPTALQPFARLGADVADLAQRAATPILMAGLNSLPARKAILDRFGSAVSIVTTTYLIQGPASRVSRSSSTLGFWWTPAIFCTTREAAEPWAFDAADATVLQLGGARLRKEAATMRIAATRDRHGLDLELSDLERRLPKRHSRDVYAVVAEVPKRIRLADRDDVSNLTCLRFSDDVATGPMVAGPSNNSTTVAAFAPGRSFALVWTDTAAGPSGTLTLTAPVHRYTFGSPLVSASGVVGMVSSATRAWPIEAVAAAAARAPCIRTRAS